MIKVGFKRPRDWARLGQRELQQLKRLILADLQAGLQAMQESILQTPVYTGRTLINYRWSLGTPYTEARQPVKDPLLPGKTSALPLGPEPRRSANAAVVQEEFAAVMASLRRDPLQTVYLTNNTPYFDQVEYGSYSTSEGSSVRTPPGGMVRRGETILEANVLGLRRSSGGV